MIWGGSSLVMRGGSTLGGSTGYQPDDSGYEIEVLFESVFTGNVPLDAIMWLQVPSSIR